MNVLLALSLGACSLVLSACSDDDGGSTETPSSSLQGVVWDGPELTFTKIGTGDPEESANQDRLSDNVWLTRSGNGGQIYNIRVETSANKDVSPEGTLWAVGQLDQRETLNFRRFRSAVGSPKDVVGKPLVAYLQADSVFVSVEFTSWDERRGGGFSYVRSTEP